MTFREWKGRKNDREGERRRVEERERERERERRSPYAEPTGRGTGVRRLKQHLYTQLLTLTSSQA